MKWLRKKPSSSSPPPPCPSSSSSHAFPVSWVSKFKQKRESPGKENKQSSRFTCSPNLPAGFAKSRFRTQEGNDVDGYEEGGCPNGFGKLSFEEDDPDHDLQIMVAQRGNCGNGKNETSDKKDKTRQHSHMPFGAQRMKATRKEAENHEDHHKTYQRIMEATSELRRGYNEPNQQKQYNAVVSDQTDDQVDEIGENSSQEIPSKQIRKSIYIGGGSQGRPRPSKHGKVKVRVSPPRTSPRRETCKIKALENIKRTQEHKKKKAAKHKSSEAATAGMESFAVVKHSEDPRQDFRDSMMEMILEKQIKKPEQMEELLACYLTLNADEYHDLIIKVFRQVWRELDDMQALNQQLEELNMVFHN